MLEFLFGNLAGDGVGLYGGQALLRIELDDRIGIGTFFDDDLDGEQFEATFTLSKVVSQLEPVPLPAGF